MNKNYEFPSIEILNYESDILTAEASVVIDFPWSDENETDFFE